MGEEVLIEQKQVLLNAVTAKRIGRKYTPDDCLSFIDLPLHIADGTEAGYNKNLQISDGTIRDAIQAIFVPLLEAATAEYEAAKTAAIAEGLTSEDEGFPVMATVPRADEQKQWAAIVEMVENGATAQEVVDLLKSKEWGKVMLRKACAK